MTSLSTNTVLHSKHSRYSCPKITTAFRNPKGATVSASNQCPLVCVLSRKTDHQLAVVKHLGRWLAWRKRENSQKQSPESARHQTTDALAPAALPLPLLQGCRDQWKAQGMPSAKTRFTEVLSLSLTLAPLGGMVRMDFSTRPSTPQHTEL